MPDRCIDGGVAEVVARARGLSLRGDEERALATYVEALRIDPTHFEALSDLGVLAYGRGHRSAARMAHAQAVRHHPDMAAGRVNLANLLAEDGAVEEAAEQFEAALAIDPELPEAHQGLARIYAAEGDPREERHLAKGFASRACLPKGFRGVGAAAPILLLASVRLGNMHPHPWLDDDCLDVTLIHVEFWDVEAPLPPHAMIVNLVGDAELCGEALIRAEAIVARSAAPVLNCPSRVMRTGRESNARRFRPRPGFVVPEIEKLTRAEIAAVPLSRYPLLIRSPGFHTGRHFVRVETPDDLGAALERLPGVRLAAMNYIDTRGADGRFRKYRVLCIDGVLYPLHLAVSDHWKVHYFTAAMADDPARRAEEERFLGAMSDTLGARAMAALCALRDDLQLDYFGVDFALAADGSIVLFEANATMVAPEPATGAIWDYRRAPVRAVNDAVRRMTRSRLGWGG